MYLSVVTTMYRSAANLPEFYARVKAQAEKLTDDYEIVLVNDGSPDNSLDVAVSLYQQDPHVRVIDFSRNFGHHKAMMTGISHARGDYVFLIDCDLEEEPELLSTFHETLCNHKNADVVYGVQEVRKGSWFEQMSGKLFYKLFNSLSLQKIPENLITARLMTKRYVDALVNYRESELIISGLWQSTGFVQIPVTVHKYSVSQSTYSLSRKFGYAVKAITSFSNRPLIFIAYVGALILMASLAIILYMLLEYLIHGTVPEGYTSLIVSVWFLGGLIVFCIGIVAVYIAVIFSETKHRPYTIIRHIYESKDQS